ncbi:MAG: murein L,D-transpeptidase [Alphaproteobacteria bacterium]|nr:murein L,D-transpeptidase [Alphaproteobacteria bacterium]
MRCVEPGKDKADSAIGIESNSSRPSRLVRRPAAQFLLPFFLCAALAAQGAGAQEATSQKATSEEATSQEANSQTLASRSGDGAPQRDISTVVTPQIPLPPEAPVDFSAAVSPAQTPPPFAVELPPAAPFSVDPQFTPFGLALKAAVEALSAPAPARPVRGRPARAAAPDLNQSIAAFYAARDYRPLWFVDGRWTPAAASALAQLARAHEDGLDLRAYPVPAVTGNDPVADARRELELSRAVAAYGMQASGGRVAPRTVSALITSRPPTANPADVLARVSASPDAARALQDFNPPHAGYRALRAKLAEMRGARESQPVAIGPGKILRVGISDERVPLIRARFNLGPADEGRNTLYDSQVAGAIAGFQKSKGMRADGRLTPQTVVALSGGRPALLEAEIIANMERWRWLPRDLGSMHIIVNIPEYQVRVIRDGQAVHSARAIVGKAETPTPVFSDHMKFMVVNPSWYVPPSIIKKSSPEAFARQGYEVRQTRNGLMVRQPPGPGNALGNVKFMFPNDHAVYLHDTNARHLFNASLRAFSHGCVRVQNPFKLAEAVMSTAPGWSERRLASLVGRGEMTVNLPQHLPIHLVYFTTFVDGNGELQTRGDLYGFSRRLRAAMGLGA